MKKTLKVNVDFIGQVPSFDPPGLRNESDYRPVPASDRGNATYSDEGMLGSYTSRPEQYDNPEGVRLFTGFGATEADLVRGFQEPAIRDNPAYDLDNYFDRSTLPRLSDLDEGGDAMENDLAFRRRNERARGFLTRNRIPTDR